MIIYTAFFCVLFTFYGLPIHIMRDVFMTTRSFVKRLHALLRYRQALRDMNKYPDATAEELGREDTCIICREEMHPWDAANPGHVERSRPKKLPCGHILHFGCLKSWLERQQVCPTCRRSVVIDAPPQARNGDPMVFRLGLNFPARNPGQQQAANAAAPGGAQGGLNGGQDDQQGNGNGRVRMFNFGPVRIGFAQGDDGAIRDMAQQMGVPPNAATLPVAAGGAAVQDQDTNGVLDEIRDQLADVNQRVVWAGQRVQQDMQQLQVAEAQLNMMHALLQEMARLSQMGQALQQQEQQPQQPQQPSQQNGAPPHGTGTGPLPQPQYQPQPLQHVQPFPQPVPAAFYPAAAPGYYAPAQAMQPLNPFAAARMQAPVTRHGGAAMSAAIPAGSPDLPEGVVIPPGWSLLPLRRLDDGMQQPAPAAGSHQAQPPQHGSTIPNPGETETSSGSATVQADIATGSSRAAPQGATAGTGMQVPTAGVPQAQAPHPAGPAADPLRNLFLNEFAARQTAGAEASSIAAGQSSTAAPDHPAEQEPRGRSPPAPASTRETHEPQTEQPRVTAPTPVLPNWGGPAQLFGRGNSGARDTAASTPVQEPDEDPLAEQNGRTDGKSAEEKGKARAVTVEDDESENE